MQIIQSKSNYIDKVIYDKSGRLVRATFFVYERDGRIKAKLIKFVFVDQLDGDNGFVLSAHYEKELIEIFLLESKEVTSPYVEKVLTFSGSKPRAPTV